MDGGAHWNVMTDKEYSRYFLSYDMLSFPTNTNEDTDLILRSSILSLGKELRFRQSCILKAFSSTVPNSLYTHYENGLYYIKLTAENFYTFGYYSKLQEENFAFTPSDFPQVQNICTGEMPINNIAFEFVSSNAINAQMYDAMKDIVNYQVVRVVGEEEKIVSLHLIPTRELEQQLFSFGPDIEILSPSTYREEFAKKIAENVKKAQKKRDKKKAADSKNVNSMAQTYTRRIEETRAKILEDAEKREKEMSQKQNKVNEEKASTYKTNAKPGSLASKANMVSDFNNRNR